VAQARDGRGVLQARRAPTGAGSNDARRRHCKARLEAIKQRTTRKSAGSKSSNLFDQFDPVHQGRRNERRYSCKLGDACTQRHLRPLIGYLRPAAVVGMGNQGWRAVLQVSRLVRAPRRISLAAGSCWSAADGTWAFAVGHCKPARHYQPSVVTTNRGLAQDRRGHPGELSRH
jgi:hypothetical protein